MPFERRRDGHSVRVVARHPHRQRLERTAERIRRLGIEDAAQLPPCHLDFVHELLASGDNAGEYIAVAVEILGRALHDQIDAHFERPLIDRARKRVVDHAHHATCPAGRGHAADVYASQMRVGRRLEPHQTRAVPNQRPGLPELVYRDEARADAEPRQQLVQQMERAAVHRRTADHFVAWLEQRQKQCGRRRHPRPEQQRPIGGLTLWEASIELRFPLTFLAPLGAVVFLDSSDVRPERLDYRFDTPHLAPGVGLRYPTPVGPVRLDLGFRVLEALGQERPQGTPPELFGDLFVSNSTRSSVIATPLE